MQKLKPYDHMSHTTRIPYELNSSMVPGDSSEDVLFIHDGDCKGPIDIKQAGADWSEVTEVDLSVLVKFLATVPVESLLSCDGIEDLTSVMVAVCKLKMSNQLEQI